MNSLPLDVKRMRDHARSIFNAGVAAVAPDTAVKKCCKRKGKYLYIDDHNYDLSHYQSIYVIGAGKASAPMAKALEELIGDNISDGLINVKYAHTEPLNSVQIVEAGHPIPDQNGEQGARLIVEIAKRATENDLVLCVISGGGSALLPLASAGLTLKDKQDTTDILLACGASIHEINTLRKHMSAVKGGRLAEAIYPATCVSLILSDVIGDDLDTIASGPTVPDSTLFSNCMDIIHKYDIGDHIPLNVLQHIQSGANGNIEDTPKSGDPIFDKSNNLIIGSNIEAILAAKHAAEELGYHCIVLSSLIEGETRDVAQVHTAIAREILKTGHPIDPPACILSGGETTVTLQGGGLGGRNQEFALAAALDIIGCNNIVVLSGGTDGTDGPTDAAGAVVDSQTLKRAISAKLDPMVFLNNNDSYPFFEKLGDLLITGPTKTNVMDLRIILVV